MAEAFVIRPIYGPMTRTLSCSTDIPPRNLLIDEAMLLYHNTIYDASHRIRLNVFLVFTAATKHKAFFILLHY